MEPSNDLLQSHAWEQFQRALGRRTWRVDGTLVIAMPLPLGEIYLYAPRGVISPLPSWRGRLRGGGTEGTAEGEDQGIENIVRESGAVFLRAEYPTPPSPPSQREGGEQDTHLVIPRVLRRAIEPEWTWRVSLEPDEDAMLAGMHEKHRYNVRLAEKRGVRVSQYVSESVSQERFGAFWSLLQETARRQGIGTHPRAYYETMLRALGQTSDVVCFLYLAEREGVPCVAAIVAYHGDTATYLHGGSSHTQRQHMAPHLLHWQAMRDAKHAGMRWYDFGGVEVQEGTMALGHQGFRALGQEIPSPPALKPSGPQALRSSWSGMTRFKMGFGGEAVHHPPMRDLVFRRGWYTILAWMAILRP